MNEDPYPWTGTYFSGVPVRVEAIPEPGYEFVGWVELPGETSAVVEVDPGEVSKLTAIFQEAHFPTEPVVLHGWDFEGTELGNPAQTIGGGLLSVEETGEAEAILYAKAQGFDSNHLRVNNPLGATLTWSLPTPGFEALHLEFDFRRSGQGPGNVTVWTTTDGEDWTLSQTLAVADADPQSVSVDFGELTGAENNPDFGVKFTFERASGGNAGNVRFDNVVLRGRPMASVNSPPVVLASVGFQELVAGGDGFSVDLGTVFADADEADELSYSLVVDAPGVVTASMEEGELIVHGVAAGNASVTLSASDGVNDPVETSFAVLVYPAAHILGETDFVWREWSAQEPAGAYPAHMVFLQSDKDDPGLNKKLDRAYEIPVSDASESGDVDFPYGATKRTRINGLGERGISFINTGRGRDVGSALLALDTRGVDGVEISWVAETLTPNFRVYALRMQVREGPGMAWEDVEENGQAVEYVRSKVAGDKVQFGPVSLAAKWLDKPHVQVQWRYYQIDKGPGGARAELRLDDVVVTTGGEPRDYESWRLAEYPGWDERDEEGISGPLALSDGASNLYRYALGAGRQESLGGLHPVVERGELGQALVSFRYNPNKKDIRYVLKRSEDMRDWSRAVTVWDSEIDGPGAAPVSGWLSVPDADAATLEAGFYRVEVGR